MSAIDRLFNNLAGIGNDSCDLTNKNKQNMAALGTGVKWVNLGRWGKLGI